MIPTVDAVREIVEQRGGEGKHRVVLLRDVADAAYTRAFVESE